MDSPWKQAIKNRASTALLAIQKQEEDNAYCTLKSVQDSGFTVTLIGENQISVKPNRAGLKLTENQKTRIRKHKELILHLVKPRPKKLKYPKDWKDEWRLEQDFLLRRAACCTKKEDQERCLELAKREVIDQDEFILLWRQIREVEIEMRDRGELPEGELFHVEFDDETVSEGCDQGDTGEY